MTKGQMAEIRKLEGQRVSLALAGGSRIDDVMLVSSGGGRTGTMWLDVNGIDVFVPVGEVRDVWESALSGSRAA